MSFDGDSQVFTTVVNGDRLIGKTDPGAAGLNLQIDLFPAEQDFGAVRPSRKARGCFSFLKFLFDPGQMSIEEFSRCFQRAAAGDGHPGAPFLRDPQDVPASRAVADELERHWAGSDLQKFG